MALLSCPNCGHSVSDRAARCPKCGCELTPVVQSSSPQPASGGGGKNKAIIWVLAFAVAVLAVLCVVFAMGGDKASVAEASAVEQVESVDSVPAVEPSGNPEVDDIMNKARQAANDAIKEAQQRVEEHASANLADGGTFHLTGTVAGNGCKMDLTISGNRVYGSYSYNKYGTPITLDGSISGGRVHLDQISDEGEITSELNGRFSGDTFTGTHTRYKTMRNTSFTFKVQ